MTSPEKPRILIATGRTCSGKSTLVGNLIGKDSFKMLDAKTTRPPRDSDLPGEYSYITNEEYDAIPAPDMIFSTKHGSPSRYTLLRSAIKAALADPHHIYTRPLSPSSASKVVNEFGEDSIKVLYLPTPNPEEAERRIVERGDSLAILAARATNEESWDDLAGTTSGIHIAKSTTIEDIHAETLILMGLQAAKN